MKNINSLFLGGKIKNWSPFLQKEAQGFLKSHIYFYPNKVIKKLNNILNLLFYSIIQREARIWVIGDESFDCTFFDKYASTLKQINVFYISDNNLPKGFLTNNSKFGMTQKLPQLVLFPSIGSGQLSLLKDLKKKGVICIGFSSEFIANLDFTIYSKTKPNGLFTIVSLFLLFVSLYKLNKNEKIEI